MSPAKAIVRTLGVGFATILILFTAYLGFERWRGATALNRRTAALRSAGERLLVSELVVPGLDPQSNAHVALLSISNGISAMFSNLRTLPPHGQWTTNGTVIATSKLARWGSGTNSNSWNEIHSVLKKHSKTLDELRSALERPGWDEGFDYTSGFGDFKLPGLVDTKRAAQILQIAALAEIQAGNGASAFQLQRQLLKLVQLQGSSRLIISHLVRIATGHYAWTVTWEGLHANVWNASQLKELQKLWSELEFQTGVSQAMEMERAMSIDLFHQAAGNLAIVQRQIDQRFQAAEVLDWETDMPAGRFIERWIHAPLWRIAWIQQDALRAMDRWQLAIDADRAIRSGPWEKATAQLDLLGSGEAGLFGILAPEESPSLSFYDRCRYLLSGGAFSINAVVIRKAPRAELLRHLAIVAIALARFRTEHSRYPVELRELAPRYLAAPSIDPADGEPLRYKMETDSYVLYSIGENLTDEGGSARPANPDTLGHSLWTGLDIVWPRSATSKEINP